MKIYNFKRIILYLLAFLIPSVLVLFFCAIRKISPNELYIPSSYNNDCVFYYKMVDAICNHGRILGYFGYNESKALYGGYGVWSPLTIFFWILWGAVFGWNYYSGIICNIVILSFGFLSFVSLSEIRLKNVVLIYASLLFFPAFQINALNLLPESSLLFLLLVYFGMIFKINNNGFRFGYFLSIIIIIIFLSFVRPYFLSLFIFPFCLSVKNKQKISAFCVVILSLFSFLGFLLVSHFFTSPYFTPSFNYDILGYLFRLDFRNFIGYLLYLFKSMFTSFIIYIKNAFDYGLTVGTIIFSVFIIIVIMLVYCLINRNFKHKNIYYLYILFCLFQLIAETIFAQRANEACRHFWCYSIIGIILICTSEFINIIKIIPLIFNIIFCARGAFYPTDYDVPLKNTNVIENVTFWESIFDNNDILCDTDGFSNTVIWVIGDYIDDVLYVTEYSELYSLPSGVGVSCCYSDYVADNIETLKSRYIITIPDGIVSDLCIDNGYYAIASNDYAVMYKRY